MNTLIVGPGGVGGYLGGVLAAGGVQVAFLAPPTRAATLRSAGLRVRTRSGVYYAPHVRLVDAASEFRDFDLILVCVKYFSLGVVTHALRGSLADHAVVLTVQNGIDADLEVRRATGHPHVFPGAAHIGAWVDRESGDVVLSDEPPYFVFGARESTSPVAIHRTAAALAATGLDVRTTDHIEQELWFKYLFILPYSGVTAAFARSFQAVYSMPRGRRVFATLLDEAVRVARAAGVRLPPDVVTAVTARAEEHMRRSHPATSSLQRDRSAGRPSEVEALHGTLLRLARAHNVVTPVTRAIYQRIAGPNALAYVPAAL